MTLTRNKVSSFLNGKTALAEAESMVRYLVKEDILSVDAFCSMLLKDAYTGERGKLC